MTNTEARKWYGQDSVNARYADMDEGVMCGGWSGKSARAEANRVGHAFRLECRDGGIRGTWNQTDLKLPVQLAKLFLQFGIAVGHGRPVRWRLDSSPVDLYKVGQFNAIAG